LDRNSDHRRKSFDSAADLYDRRPAYPRQLVEEVMLLARIEKGTRVLEIGPGTGQLSVALAQRGASLLAVELGSNLAEVLSRKLAPFAEAEVVVADFDHWTAPPATFDAVVAATCFHWLDPSNRVAKCASLLRPGGSLAIVETCWGVAVDDDAFFRASQACYSRWTPNPDPKFRQARLEDVTPVAKELTVPEFAGVDHRRYPCAREYSTAAYCDLLRTFSDVIVLEEASRAGFLACISSLIDVQFGGRVVRNDLHDLSVARRAE
jgi:SAM-dependent methyltransferase